MDENYGMYYEDTDWCYRARIYGYPILACPKAAAYHAFGGSYGHVHNGLAPNKLKEVTYSRLRFATKLVPFPYLARFLGGYFLEDGLHILLAMLRLRLKLVGVYLAGWLKWLRDLPEVWEKRSEKGLHGAKIHQWQIKGGDHFRPIQWRGLPEITMMGVVEYYLPMILAGKTRPIPEFEDLTEGTLKSIQISFGKNQRLRTVTGNILENKIALFWKKIQWHLMSGS